MNHFELKGGELACEDVPLAHLVKDSGRRVRVPVLATMLQSINVSQKGAAAPASPGPYGAPRTASLVAVY